MTARVTITLPDDLQQAVASAAERTGKPFSVVVSEALAVWARGQLVDAWLVGHEAEHGDLDEDELKALARDAGVPYIPPDSEQSESFAA